MPQINEATDRSLPTRTEATASSIAGGRAYVADMARRLARYVVRSQSRQRVMASVHGLLSEAERKNSGHVAEACGDPTPYGFQDLLARADWDADMVRDELRTYLCDRVARFRAAITARRRSRSLGTPDTPCGAIMPTRGAAGGGAGTAVGGVEARSGPGPGTTMALAAASATPRRVASAVKDRVGACPSVRRVAGRTTHRTGLH
jgi:hypothetical protein